MTAQAVASSRSTKSIARAEFPARVDRPFGLSTRRYCTDAISFGSLAVESAITAQVVALIEIR